MKKISNFLFILLFLAACAPVPVTQTSEASKTLEVLPTVTATYTPEPTATPSPTPDPWTAAANAIVNEMKGKAPQMADASMGDFSFVKREDEAYRIVNENLGLDQVLNIEKDEYGERLVGEDGRTVLLKDKQGKWVIAPFWRWGEQRIELGIVERYNGTVNGIKSFKLVGELVGYEDSVKVEYKGETHELPVAVFWVGNSSKGERILFRTLLGFFNGTVLESAYRGTTMAGDPNGVNSTTPLFARGVSPSELQADLMVGGTYAFSILLPNDGYGEYVNANRDLIAYLRGYAETFDNTSLGIIQSVYVPMAKDD